VPPWTFRPHARHFRRKLCHVQRTVTFNSVSIPKLPPTSSNPLNLHITYIVDHCGDLLAFFCLLPHRNRPQELEKLDFEVLLLLTMQPFGPSGTATSESDSSRSWATSTVKPLCYCKRPACVLTLYTEKKFGRRFRKCENYKV
jgi:hypothetical protein